MDKTVIKNAYSIPAFFTATSAQSDNPLFTRAKLKVFYVGETADHRLFTREFSDNLVKTLPYSPVVSKYNEKEDDFEGHASEQNIYGIVDPLVEPTFETIDGVEWAVCDVILYTKRPGKAGEIASKIIGQPQSLELDPNTVQYKVNRELGTGKFKNIEFIEGNFIGVSVLGKKQEPAFTGSAFFDAEAMKKFAEVYETRGGQMEIKIPNFLNESWGERYEMLMKALYKNYGDDAYPYLVDFYDDAVIFKLFTEENTELLKAKYSIQEGQVILEEPKKVRIEYVEVQEAPKEVTNAEGIPATTESPVGEPAPEKKQEPGQVEGTFAKEETPLPQTETPAPAVVEGLDENVKKEEETANAATFSEDERRELEHYRREDKISVINSFSDIIDEAELDNYIKNVDNYSREELKADLAIKAVEVARHSQNLGFKATLPSTKRVAKSEEEALAERLRANSAKK